MKDKILTIYCLSIYVTLPSFMILIVVQVLFEMYNLGIDLIVILTMLHIISVIIIALASLIHSKIKKIK